MHSMKIFCKNSEKSTKFVYKYSTLSRTQYWSGRGKDGYHVIP